MMQMMKTKVEKITSGAARCVVISMMAILCLSIMCVLCVVRLRRSLKEKRQRKCNESCVQLIYSECECHDKGTNADESVEAVKKVTE